MSHQKLTPNLTTDAQPWLTDQAINFLTQLCQINPQLKVLEFGSGGSTIWFAQRVSELVSIEHNPSWYQEVTSVLKTLLPLKLGTLTPRHSSGVNAPCLPVVALAKTGSKGDGVVKLQPALQSVDHQVAITRKLLHPPAYYQICQEWPANYFDLILVDALERVQCVQQAIRILKPGGVLMLDNCERPPYQIIYAQLASWVLTKTSQAVTQNGVASTHYTDWWIKPN